MPKSLPFYWSPESPPSAPGEGQTYWVASQMWAGQVAHWDEVFLPTTVNEEKKSLYMGIHSVHSS